MCLAMQSFDHHHLHSPENISILMQMFETFYEFVDAQADTLTRLRMLLDEGLCNVSPETLKTGAYSVKTQNGLVSILEHAGCTARKGVRHA